MADYDAVIIGQPEIFISPESKYKGFKPDALKILADSFATLVAEELEGTYRITTEPGPGVLHMRWAVTNLMLKRKWSKNPLAYTPVGAAANAIKKGVTSDITKKVQLKDVTLEIEFVDSVSGERLVAAAERRKKKGEDNLKSWDDLEELLSAYGRLTKCRLDNARVPQEQWIDCVEQFQKDLAK
jgi:hypothetical protein